MVATGMSGTPRRLGAFLSRQRNEQPWWAWSWKGNRLAVGAAERNGPARIVVFDVPAEGARTPTSRTYDLGKDNGCDNLNWLPDDSGILMLCYKPEGPRIARLRLSDGEITPVVANDDPQQIWEFYTSPDGKYVAYTVQRENGTSIYAADLKSLVKGSR